MAHIKISFINESTVISADKVKTALTALQKQVTKDFAPVWGIDADLTLIAKNQKPPPSSWWLVILDNSDQAGALGYHDLTDKGLPLAKVFAKTSEDNGESWTLTASHELLEMLADPDVNLSVFNQTSKTSGTLFAYEVCDPCEDNRYGYKIGDILVSDFVYPTWFQSFRSSGKNIFDHGNYIKKPLELLPGGYIGTFDVAKGSGWKQSVFSRTSPIYCCHCDIRNVPLDQRRRSERR